MQFIKDRYKIIKKLNGGNMSSVYLCIDFEDQKEVVIKVFELKKSNNYDLHKALFYREIENLENMDNDKIIKLLDKGIDTHNCIYFIVLEYFQSKPLSELMFQDIFTEKQKNKIIIDILNGISHAHSKGIIHRDLKPSNILVSDSNDIKLIDFGISKLRDSFYNDLTVNSFHTPKYASPEQRRLQDIDFQSDIYSIGIVISEILLDKEFSYKENVIESVSNSALAKNVKEILLKAINDNLSDRFLTINEMLSRYKETLIGNTEIKDKIFGFGFANSISRKLMKLGIISSETRLEVLQIISRDLSGQNIHIRESFKDRKNQSTYSILGRQFEYNCVIDERNNSTFTAIGLSLPSSYDYNLRKEQSIVYDGEFEVCLNINSDHDFNNIVELISFFERSKEIRKIQKEKEMNEKNSINRWEKVIHLLQTNIEENKQTLQYSGFEIDATGEKILVQLKNEISDKVFEDDQLLCMTSLHNIHKNRLVGYCIDTNENNLVVQLSKDANPSDFALSGEISVDKGMVENSLNRQKKALKAVQFKEMKNPIIADVLLNPQKASYTDMYQDIDFECELDSSKKNAVEKAIQSRELFVLQGPPGTGKTTFISELVNQIFKSNPNSKVLISSQSNVAVDHALNKIHETLPKLELLRIGRKDKLSLGTEKYMIGERLVELIKRIKEKSQNYLDELKKEISLDETIIENYAKVLEIERLKDEISKTEKLIDDANTNLTCITKAYEELSNLTNELENVSSTLTKEIETINSMEVNSISDKFQDRFISIGRNFLKQLDIFHNISFEKNELEDKVIRLMYENENNQSKIAFISNELSIKTSLEFYNLKTELIELLQDNKNELENFKKIEKIQKEWSSRLISDEKIQELLIQHTHIIGATCLGISGLPYSSEISFDWVIVDEAGRATAPELLLPITLGKKVVLVGDHKQLPPILDTNIKDIDFKKENIKLQDLEKSLFEEILENINPNCVGQLDEQYRMHPAIGNLISTVFYDGKLKSKTTVETRNHEYDKWKDKGVVWLSTSKSLKKGEQIIKGNSYRTYQNELEVEVIFSLLLSLEEEYRIKGINKEVGVIAGYQAQKNLIRKEFETKYQNEFKNLKVEINTVDAFQGRETDIILYSIVRSNEEGKIGFLKDSRRLNVALSRAKELLVIVGDHLSTTRNIKGFDGELNPFWNVYNYISSNPDLCTFEELSL